MYRCGEHVTVGMKVRNVETTFRSFGFWPYFFVEKHLSSIFHEVRLSDVHRFFSKEVEMIQSEFIEFILHSPDVRRLNQFHGFRTGVQFIGSFSEMGFFPGGEMFSGSLEKSWQSEFQELDKAFKLLRDADEEVFGN